MASPLRPAERHPDAGPLRIVALDAYFPKAYVPGEDAFMLSCKLSRGLTVWERRAAEQDPMLEFDPDPNRVRPMGMTLGRFTEDSTLEVTLHDITDFDIDDYRAALLRLEDDGIAREEDAGTAIVATTARVTQLRNFL